MKTHKWEDALATLPKERQERIKAGARQDVLELRRRELRELAGKPRPRSRRGL